jgi:lipoic acid synthetase
MRKPHWLAKKIIYTDERREVNTILHNLGLHTVCKSARCPNLSECYAHRRATFMILGVKCTRCCTFCSVEKAGKGVRLPLDEGEPEGIVEAVKELGLKYVVITSVTRDDLQDGGAGQFVRAIKKIREYDDRIKIEVLTPDFQGNKKWIDTVAGAHPDVYNHNVETIPRLYAAVRPGADYQRSIDLLSHVHIHHPGLFLKSGLMVGLGETEAEILDVLKDLRSAGCDAVTIGQYLRPGYWNIPVHEYITPEKFNEYKMKARKLGFRYVASGPYVRSSYMAQEAYKDLSGRI